MLGLRSPKWIAIAAGGLLLAILAVYLLRWRPVQPLFPFTPIQEKTISDLEAANKKASEERESLRNEAKANALRATQAQTEAAKARVALRELEALNSEMRAKRGANIVNPEEAIKQLKASGWLK